MKGAPGQTPEGVLRLLAESMPERVAPGCPHFGSCGGCQLQELPYTSQVTAKKAMLLDVIRDAGIAPGPQLVVHEAEPWGYRNRIRMRIDGDCVGYSRRESHAFLPVETCPIASPLLERAAFSLRDLVRAGGFCWPDGAAAFELFTDAGERAVQMSLHLDVAVAGVSREAPAVFRRLCEALQRVVPQLAGAGLLAAAPDPSQSRRVQSTQRVEIAKWGAPSLAYTVAGQTYSVTRNAFFQVNRFLTEEMVQIVTEGKSGRLALDLFAGAGLFSVALARQFETVIAVEIGQPAAGDLARHLADAGPSHKAVQRTTEAFLERENSSPDLVVMDPPRAGVSLGALRELSRLGPREVVYVSCDAGTFVRDARTLIESGYSLLALHLFDLFPQTFHTETIAHFRR